MSNRRIIKELSGVSNSSYTDNEVQITIKGVRVKFTKLDSYPIRMPAASVESSGTDEILATDCNLVIAISRSERPGMRSVSINSHNWSPQNTLLELALEILSVIDK